MSESIHRRFVVTVKTVPICTNSYVTYVKDGVVMVFGGLIDIDYRLVVVTEQITRTVIRRKCWTLEAVDDDVRRITLWILYKVCLLEW